MQWQIIVALVIMVPVILAPVVLIWFLNLGGIAAAIPRLGHCGGPGDGNL